MHCPKQDYFSNLPYSEHAHLITYIVALPY